MVDPSPIKFPQVFPLKAIGKNADDFEGFVVSVVREHAPQATPTVKSEPSQGGKYLAVTVTFMAESREQLDAIYLQLSKSGRVLVSL